MYYRACRYIFSTNIMKTLFPNVVDNRVGQTSGSVTGAQFYTHQAKP